MYLLFKGVVIDHDVVQVHYNKAVEEWIEGFIHKCAKYDWCIGKAKWHNNEFKISIPYDASRLRFISFGNPDLVVSRM